ncbi:MAG TPA: hypothetical protein VFM46_17965, partial [Pseudomonadales bacterium]|nr:hypothetical protein [Pseudomonadales bacterium]
VAEAADQGVKFRMAASDTRPHNDNLFGLPDPGRYELEEASFTGQKANFYGQLTLYNERVDGDSTGRADINEIYWKNSFAYAELTLGKKRLGWGVGYGFRPLDVIVREPRRQLISATTVGLPMVALDFFNEKSNLTFLCGSDLGDDDRLQPLAEKRGSSQECALRFYQLVDTWDWQIVLHHSPNTDTELGTGFSGVVGDSLELHGELLNVRQYYQWHNSLLDSNQVIASRDPMVLRERMKAWQSVAGFTYTWANGFSVLGEAWFDGTALDQREWRAVSDLTRQQIALLSNTTIPAYAIEQNRMASARYLMQQNLAQKNVLARVSFDGETHDPALDCLYLPETGDTIVTLSDSYKIRQALTLEFGARYFSAKKDSVVDALPYRLQAYLSLTASTGW